MASNAPVGLSETLQLTSLGIAKANIKFSNVSMQSSKFICVREEKNLAVIDTSTKNVLRLPIKVDSAIMNPVSRVVALRAENNLQIYNLEMKSRMKSTQLANVQFWRWIDTKTVALVTDKTVYHWSMDGDSAPKKMFDRAASSTPVQIINYQTSEDQKWLMVGGITKSPTGTGVVGVLQVFSVDRNASQPTMDSHAACFANIKLDGRDSESTLFCFTQITGAEAKLTMMEVSGGGAEKFRKIAPMKFKAGDFPVALIPDESHGVLFVITKAGMVFLYDIHAGKPLFANQASQVTMFTSCKHDDHGVAAIDQNGRMARFYVEEKNIVSYVCSVLKDFDTGVGMAKRYNLPGAENAIVEQFNQLMNQQRYSEAMQCAAESPQGVLRTADTINRFKQIPADGASPPILQYFSMLLKRDSLNKVEAVELARPVLQRNVQAGLKHIQDWLKDNKLECSEELGDLLKQHDINLALSVYGRAKVPEKVIGCFLALAAKEPNSDAASQHFEKIFKYAKTADFQPDYATLVQQLLRVNPDRAKDFALLLVRNQDGPTLDINHLVDIFMSSRDIKNTTNILLSYLQTRGDREEDGELQTKLLEINLMAVPHVARAILDSDDYKFSHYNRPKVAALCERAQLYEHALTHYDDLEDIKRVLGNAPHIKEEFLLEFFGRMTPENCLECLRDLLRFNLAQNIRLVVKAATQWSEYLTAEKLIEMFEEFNSYHGIYYYLGSFVAQTDDSAVVFKYIQAAVELKQFKEVERVCRDNDHYEAKEVKEYLLEKNLSDPRPLIHVCDRFDFVDELTQYLYSNNMFAFVEAYVQRMNPRACPAVVGALLDLNANEDQISELIVSVRPPIDDETFVGRLVQIVEEHGRLKLLRNWLEARAADGSEDPELHNGLAKIYVETNNNPRQFLTNNKFYQSKVVGEFCESRDPHLAFIAFKRAGGECDQELIEVTNKHGFFKDQARYLVERQDLGLWEQVLVADNPHRRSLIDQVVATALPESKIPEEVSTTVKAFMAANLPNELIELLERIILQGPSDGAFHKNKNLQNLLILTAIKADPKRVMDYVNRLDNYDGLDIAKIAVSEQYQLYEEAFFVYKKFKAGTDAILVLLNYIEDIPRAVEFAEYWDKAEVWSLLAKAQLDADMVKDSIGSYLKAEDAKHYTEVIAAAREQELFNELINYLLMAREKVRESIVDNELLYAYAKTKRLGELEDFIVAPNIAKYEVVGDQCYNEGLYEAGRILFSHINNNAKLAMCLVKLELFQEAYDAARKANSIPTWKAVCFSCVDHEKFRLAQLCGVNIIVYNDHLLELIRYYEQRGHFSPLISLLEQGVSLDRAHQGIYTQLGVLYAKYKEDKLMEHIRMFHSRLNIPTLLSVCKENLHWPETVYLYNNYDQFDNAVDTMMRHSTACWEHKLFKDTTQKVGNSELYYRAIDFYIAEHPLELNDLLLDLANRLDHTRAVRQVKDLNHLPLIKKYLLHAQRENITAVNEAVNELAVAEEDHVALRESIDLHDSFDQIALALQLENHELLEMRRISSLLMKTNGRFDKSIELSKRDKLWGDAMQTAADSKDKELAEGLLRFFVENKEQQQPECFAAALFTCYELISPDVVLELAWRHGLMNFAMPFMIQSFRDFDLRLTNLTRRLDEQNKKVDETKQQSDATAAAAAQNPAAMFGMGNGGMPLAIMPPGPPGFGVPPPNGMGYPPAGPQPGYY
jgi:clathrin heavy chain